MDPEGGESSGFGIPKGGGGGRCTLEPQEASRFKCLLDAKRQNIARLPRTKPR